MTKAPRTENGTLCHNEISFHEGFSPDQIWADSIYMAPPFLAEMGKVEEAYKQIKGMYNYLLDEKTGVLKHIYDAGTNRFVRDKLWATGNGWALMGMVAVTDIAAEKGFAQIADELICLSKNLLDKLLLSRGYWGRH
ncbi:MAG: glycoside hydrolase family 88 protein [Treponema sp.]|nr:glycoside hydrolase family 88 protein [Treponema sp.]